jgi:class 3 adenylate cyclase/tetratricopeptide (TPR) repeat protein
MTGQAAEHDLTILFSDVEGSTELRIRRGDDAADEILQIHETIVRKQLEEFGSTSVTFLGDGFMAAFPSPVDGVRAAIGIEQALEEHNRTDPDRQVRVRIGLHVGEVTERDGKLYGQAVHAASRVSSEAAGGQILVSAPVKDAWEAEGAETRDRGLFWLKGFPERWRLFEIGWRPDGGSAAAPPPGHAPLIEREPEHAELRRAVDLARAGHGSLLLIGGEAGIGKSRITAEIAAEAESRGMLPLVGHAIDVDAPTPYLPFVEILEQALLGPRAPEWLRDALGDNASELSRLVPGIRRIVDNLPPPLDLPPEQVGRYLWLSMQEFLERGARVRPLLLVLEDLHWTDESTLLLMEYLAAALEHMPVLILGTYRDVEVDASHPLARTMGGLARRGLVRRVSLNRLTSTGVADMIRGLAHEDPPPGLVEAIYAESDGNPFFVEEVFLHLSESGKLHDEAGRFRRDLTVGEVDVPESVRVLLGQRLELLTAPTRNALTAAAAVGRVFPLDLLLEVAATSRDAVAEALDEAEAARLVGPEDGGARFEFVHELIRQTLLSETSTLRRQALHQRAADAIEKVYANEIDEHAAELAYHLSHAGPEIDRTRLLRYLRLAGERAMQAAAFSDAVSHFERALEMADPNDPNTRAELLEHLAIALRSVGRWEDALRAMDEALTLYEQAGRMEDYGRLCWALVYQLAWAARWDEAIGLAQRGLAGLGEVVNPDRARLLAAAGWVIGGTGDAETAAQMFQEARMIADQMGDDRALADVLHLQTINHMGFAQFDQGIEAGLLAADVFEAENALWDLCSVLTFVLYQAGAIGSVEQSAALAERVRPLAMRLGHLGAVFLELADRSRSAAMRGDIDEVRDLALQQIEVCERGGLPWLYVGRTYLGLSEQWRGQWEDAGRELRDAAALEAPGAFGGQVTAILAIHLALEGRGDEVVKLLEEKREALPRPGAINTLGSWNSLVGFVEALWLVGRNDEAAALLPIIEEALTLPSEWVSFDARWVRTRAGIAAAAAGRYDEAEGHFTEVLRRGEERENKIERADVFRFLARMLLQRDEPGDRERAEEHIRSAIEEYRALGMPRHVELAAAALPGDPVGAPEA